MSLSALLPPLKSEDWRYAPQAALAAVWPVEVEEIRVSAGASERLCITQQGGEEPIARQLLVVLEDRAEFDLTLLNLGGAYSRIAVEAHLGKGARLFIGGVQLGGGGDVLEIVTEVIHEAPDAESRQVIRSVAGGHASVTYLGKVRVERGADGTDGAQSVRAMLLDRTAIANARPELEIYADDVKCAHGCAVGELDAMGLFYLASRGLPPAAAKALMLQAFIAEGLEGAGESESDNLHALALTRLQSLLEAGQ